MFIVLDKIETRIGKIVKKQQKSTQNRGQEANFTGISKTQKTIKVRDPSTTKNKDFQGIATANPQKK